jgi:hypothetical protein
MHVHRVSFNTPPLSKAVLAPVGGRTRALAFYSSVLDASAPKALKASVSV